MAHLTHLDTHARTILRCFMSCFSTDYKAASVDDMHAVCFEQGRNATGTKQTLLGLGLSSLIRLLCKWDMILYI